MANNERGVFVVVTDSGKEVKTQIIKNNGQRYYSVFGSPFTYDNKREIKECKFLNKKEKGL